MGWFVDEELERLKVSSRVAVLWARFLTECLLNTSCKCYCLSQLAQCVTIFILHCYITNTEHFIMFSVIANIYNKKTKGPTLMELFIATGKLKKFYLTTSYIWCVHHGRHGTHRVCGNDLNIVSMCAASPMVHSLNISGCPPPKKNQFSCGCEQFHWERSFGFLVINVCNNGEHYETPCICSSSYSFVTEYSLNELCSHMRTHVKKTLLEIHFTWLGDKEIYWIFKTRCIIPVLLSTNCHLFHNFISLWSNVTLFFS